MKYHFALSEWSFTNRPECWKMHLAVCINSMKANTRLHPVMYWHGNSNHPLIKVMGGLGVETILSDGRYDSFCATIQPGGQKIEVAQSVMMKFEMIERCSESFIFLGDVDLLWLKQPILTEYLLGSNGILADYQMNLGDKTFGGGLLQLYPNDFKKRKQGFMDAMEKYKQDKCLEQTILNRVFPDWVPFPDNFQWRTFWPLPKVNPCVLHFHGPKLDQINNLIKSLPADTSSHTVQLFLNNIDQMIHWKNMAEPYLNYPYPIYRQLSYLV